MSKSQKILFYTLSIIVIVLSISHVNIYKTINNNKEECKAQQETEATEETSEISNIDTEDKILSCPFCGCVAELKESNLYRTEARIECSGCGIYVNSDLFHENSAEEAKEYVMGKWNKRVTETEK